ncbi:MAG: outer membrane protein transport protein [Gammaproteobacteria bacterium]|nr:outer membrane protein transport protein [Gammaproteobacteria bacterium]MBU1480587.1 outer membrane protein transport protein [Gammaproteobacteria bacterium]
MNKQKIVASMLVVGGLVSPLAYATNGDEMMAVGSQSTALGGTGVAHFIGAESLWANPAMLGKSKGSEVTGGVNLFKPKVTNTGVPALSGVSADSTANTSYIPDLSYSSRIDDSLTYGVALAGIAGMGVDYTDAPATHISAKSELSILRVVADIAYNTDKFGVGFAPIFQSGSLMLSYDASGMGMGNVNAAKKKESSTGFGFALGGYFNAAPAVTVAAVYQSKIAAKYGTQISDAGNGFGLCQPAGGGCTGAAPFGDNLDQPAQMKLGVAYAVADSLTLTADYKLIQWGSAAGYKDFAWKDQTIIAVGAKYSANGYWLGLGYNHANDPIGTLTASPAGAPGSDVYRNAAVNFFNNMFFPAIVTNSYTFGGGYDISNALAVEGAVVITPEVKKTVDVANFGGTNTTTHSQQAYEVSLRYKF